MCFVQVIGSGCSPPSLRYSHPQLLCCLGHLRQSKGNNSSICHRTRRSPHLRQNYCLLLSQIGTISPCSSRLLRLDQSSFQMLGTGRRRFALLPSRLSLWTHSDLLVSCGYSAVSWLQGRLPWDLFSLISPASPASLSPNDHLWAWSSNCWLLLGSGVGLCIPH